MNSGKPMVPSVSMQQIIDNLPVVIFEYTVFPDGSRDFTYLSPGCETILGVNREILLQGLLPFKSFIFRDDWISFSEAFEQAITQVSSFKWEGRVLTPKAESKWIEVIGVPVIMEGGKIGWSGVISDIRQRKELEQKQKESDLRYRNLVESIPLGMGIHQNGKLVFVNEYAVQMMGASRPEDLLGRSVLDFVHPDNKEWIIERMKRVMRGESIPPAEEHFITLDGRELIVETTAIPFTYRGEPAVQIIVKDITEYKKTEEQIRKTETLFSELFNSSPMAIVLLDSNGNVDRVNQGFEQMFGFTIAELKGKSLNEFIVPKELAAEGNDLNTLISSNKVVRLETTRLRRDDTLLSVIIYGVPVHLEDETIGIFGVYVDITDQKMIEEELKTRNAELDNFVYKVSHDLRAPLSSVLGLVNLAQLRGNEDDPREYMKIIGEKVNQLDNFISDVLSHSKNLKMDINTGKIHFAQIIDTAFRDLSYMEGANEMQREVEINGTDFYSDPWRIGEIFRNLVSNAIKYRKEEESSHLVNIHIDITEESATITFTDHGIGIEEKDLSKIFEMFYRASEQSVGSGLGLYIVKNAVEKLGGKVMVESAPRVSTTFKIILPNRKNRIV
jgi:PAS domain S-box-containing protein